ncbi:MAG: CDP-alcohol phosphatidyltransferase family protein [Pirellulaceae bacterium]
MPHVKRISYSLFDPWIGPLVKKIYPILRIPIWFPPEGLILVGHLCAVIGAVGFAFSLTAWWGGWLAAFGVIGNHFFDCTDGTHARATNQCRNGGELLDHFTDPLSFAYWLIGWSVAIGRLDLGMAALVILFATAVLTNIKAKLTGEFTLASFGPTEFKAILVVVGAALSILTMLSAEFTTATALFAYWTLLTIGCVQLITGLWRAVHDVNRSSVPADVSEWQVGRTG